jgi:hypothetical protein
VWIILISVVNQYKCARAGALLVSEKGLLKHLANETAISLGISFFNPLKILKLQMLFQAFGNAAAPPRVPHGHQLLQFHKHSKCDFYHRDTE